MNLSTQQRGEARCAEATRIGNGEVIARHEMVRQRHEIIATMVITTSSGVRLPSDSVEWVWILPFRKRPGAAKTGSSCIGDLGYQVIFFTAFPKPKRGS